MYDTDDVSVFTRSAAPSDNLLNFYHHVFGVRILAHNGEVGSNPVHLNLHSPVPPLDTKN